jgi:hypothetical protein
MRRRHAVILPLLTGLAAHAQEATPQFKAGTVFVMEHAALSSLFADPKDRAFGDALGMIPDRIRELPREARGQMPPEVAPLLITALTNLARPCRIAVCYNGDNPSGGGFGYGLVASVLTPTQDDADQVQAQVTALLNQNHGGPRPMASKRFPGMMDIQTPAALLSFGPRHAADGWRYEVVFGTVTDPDAVSTALPKAPSGVEPMVRLQFDTAGLNPAMDMVKAFAAQNPQAGEGLAKLQAAGLGGSKTVKVDYVAGRGKNETVSFTTMHGARALAETWGLSTKPLSKDDFGAIPADATDAYLHHGKDGAILDLNAIVAQNAEVGHFLEQFQQATGVDLQADVVQALGTTSAVYLSDSTGGAGLGSAVAMVSVRDRARLWSAIGKLSALANMQADQIPLGPGYIRLTPTKDGGTDLMTLRFPGLPVPLELTFALTDKWFIFAPTPQAALAASRQASGHGDGGLLANKTFAAAFSSDHQATSITFSDTPRNLAGGYTFLSLLGSAVANGVRSPTDPKREPGLVVPLYNDLRRDARASVGYTYWRGDDLVTESHSDHSMLVAAAGSGGTIGKILPLIVIPAVIGASHAGGMRNLVLCEPPSAYASLAARLASLSTSPFTPEHATWTLAAQDPSLPVQFQSWLVTPALSVP